MIRILFQPSDLPGISPGLGLPYHNSFALAFSLGPAFKCGVFAEPQFVSVFEKVSPCFSTVFLRTERPRLLRPKVFSCFLRKRLRLSAAHLSKAFVVLILHAFCDSELSKGVVDSNLRAQNLERSIRATQELYQKGMHDINELPYEIPAFVDRIRSVH
jgi:hypothetical protein